MKKHLQKINLRVNSLRTSVFWAVIALNVVFLMFFIFYSPSEDMQEINAPYSAKVDSVHIQAGQKVKKGDKLFVFDTKASSSEVEEVQIPTVDDKVKLQEDEVEKFRALEREAKAEFEHYTNEESRYALARRKPNIPEEEYKKNRSAELELKQLKESSKVKLEHLSLARAESEKTLDALKISKRYGQYNEMVNPPPKPVKLTTNKKFDYVAPYDAKIEEVLVKEGDNVGNDIVIVKLLPIM